MATKSTKIQIRRDTLANWQKYNPVLADGEIAISFRETASGTETKLKVGRASGAKWSDLPYVSADTDMTKVEEVLKNYALKTELEQTNFQVSNLEVNIAQKADKETVETALAEIQQAIGLKVDKSYVDEKIDEVVDQSSGLNDKIQELESIIETKADKSFVDAELAKKALAEDVDALSAKVDEKAEKSLVESLATDVSNLTVKVGTKAEKEFVDALSTRVDSINEVVVSTKNELEKIKVSIPNLGSGTFVQLDDDTFASLKDGDIIQWDYENKKWKKTQVGQIKEWQD